MEPMVVTASAAFRNHVRDVLPAGARAHFFASVEELLSRPVATPALVLVHVTEGGAHVQEEVRRIAARAGFLVAVASDEPSVTELLTLAAAGIRGYCNSYMADVHYQHMLHTIADGQNWFAPQLLGDMVQLVQALQGSATTPDVLELLTEREKAIALAVCEGLGNRELAERFGITERTVKAHLTNIYEKTGIPDRLALASHLLRHRRASTVH